MERRRGTYKVSGTNEAGTASRRGEEGPRLAEASSSRVRSKAEGGIGRIRRAGGRGFVQLRAVDNKEGPSSSQGACSINEVFRSSFGRGPVLHRAL